MNNLSRHGNAFAQIHNDDITIHSSSVEEHVEYLRSVVQLRRNDHYTKRTCETVEELAVPKVVVTAIATPCVKWTARSLALV